MSSRSATRRAEPALLVFARAPQTGRVKTRLVPLLGEAGAARLHRKLVERTLKVAARSGLSNLTLCCTPSTKNAFFRKMQARFGVSLAAQGRGDLGERMRRALARHRPAILVGSDCAVLSTADLRAAARRLR